MKVTIMTVFALASLGHGSERLINGTPALPADWPVSVYASASGSRCSSTVVGERTLLIAAHCVSNGGSLSFKVNNQTYSGRCKHSPLYAGNSTADWALCLLNQRVALANFENLNYDPARVKVGDKLTLTGYGCVQSGGGGGNDGILRVGTSTVIRIPTSSTNNDIVTRGGAALCFGDSGGAAYFVDSRTGSRWVVGVNSRGNISTTSYLSSVATDSAKDFIKSWAEQNNQVICGVHAEAPGCRQ